MIITSVGIRTLCLWRIQTNFGLMSCIRIVNLISSGRSVVFYRFIHFPHTKVWFLPQFDLRQLFALSGWSGKVDWHQKRLSVGVMLRWTSFTYPSHASPNTTRKNKSMIDQEHQTIMNDHVVEKTKKRNGTNADRISSGAHIIDTVNTSILSICILSPESGTG